MNSRLLTLFGVFAWAAAAGGPTATALKPTLAPVTFESGGDGRDGSPMPQGSDVGAGAGGEGAPATVPPGGIAQYIPGFQQGSAYEVSDVTATPSGLVAVGFAGTGQGYYG